MQEYIRIPLKEYSPTGVLKYRLSHSQPETIETSTSVLVLMYTTLQYSSTALYYYSSTEQISVVASRKAVCSVE